MKMYNIGCYFLVFISSTISLNMFSNELNRAIENNDISMIDKLIRVQKVNVNQENEWGITPLLIAAANDSNGRIVQMLLDAGADPNKSSKEEGTTPLMFALTANNKNPVNMLLNAGAKAYVRNKYGESPLMIYVQSFALLDEEIVEKLLRAGADIEDLSHINVGVDTDRRLRALADRIKMETK